MQTKASILGILGSLGLIGCGADVSPVVVGQVQGQRAESGLMASQEMPSAAPVDLRVEINGEPRWVDLDQGQGFTVQELPVGELTFRVEIEGIIGTLELQDVEPAEVIELGASVAPGFMELRVERRDTVDPGHDPIPELPDRHLEINGDHVVHHLNHGVFEGDIVIHGRHVTVVGPDHYGCREGGRAVLDGNLIVHGDHVRVVNLEVLGSTEIHGRHVKVYEPCRRRYRRHRHDDDD